MAEWKLTETGNILPNGVVEHMLEYDDKCVKFGTYSECKNAIVMKNDDIYREGNSKPRTKVEISLSNEITKVWVSGNSFLYQYLKRVRGD